MVVANIDNQSKWAMVYKLTMVSILPFITNHSGFTVAHLD